MKPKENLLLFILVAACFSTVYATYTLPTQINMGATPAPTPENVATWETRIWIGFVGYFVLSIALCIILWKSYRAWQLQKEERRRIL